MDEVAKGGNGRHRHASITEANELRTYTEKPMALVHILHRTAYRRKLVTHALERMTEIGDREIFTAKIK